jgi:hypothetical protein
MLTKADDYPIHQTPEPIATSGTDRNFYDRYFFNGYTKDGSGFFAAAMGIYPHLNIIDASFCVIVKGIQHNLHASRILGMERMDTYAGSIAVDVLEPLKRLRVRVGENAYGLKAELTFISRAKPVEEPRFVYRAGPRTIMDYTRLTQNGTWEGWIEVHGERIEVRSTEYWGTRDRSWGVRPIGASDPQPVAPARAPQFYWVWAPLNFDDRFTLYHNNAEASGKPWNSAAVMGGLAEDEPAHMAHCSSSIVYKSGTRHAKEAVIAMSDGQGGLIRIELTPHYNFYMSGLGYMNPQWGHGHFKGELAEGYEAFDLATTDENAINFQHVQAFCTAKLTGPEGLERRGSGVLEQLVLGPHAPSGFTGLLDPAP